MYRRLLVLALMGKALAFVPRGHGVQRMAVTLGADGAMKPMGRRAANLALASSVFAAFAPAPPALAEPEYTTTAGGLQYYVVSVLAS